MAISDFANVGSSHRTDRRRSWVAVFPAAFLSPLHGWAVMCAQVPESILPGRVAGPARPFIVTDELAIRDTASDAQRRGAVKEECVSSVPWLNVDHNDVGFHSAGHVSITQKSVRCLPWKWNSFPMFRSKFPARDEDPAVHAAFDSACAVCPEVYCAPSHEWRTAIEWAQWTISRKLRVALSLRTPNATKGGSLG
jgi:hypothetical protein